MPRRIGAVIPRAGCATEGVAYTDHAARTYQATDRNEGWFVGVILKICEVGNPVLRKIARSLSADEIRSKDIQDLIGHMRDTMRDAPGVGLAAPQIGESLQIAVIEDKAEYQKGLTAEQLRERQRSPVDFQPADRVVRTGGRLLP